jgi:hypothetical protein
MRWRAQYGTLLPNAGSGSRSSDRRDFSTVEVPQEVDARGDRPARN